MRSAAPYNWAADFRCPHCGATLNVDDPDDFYWNDGPMEREETHRADCPVCEKEFEFRVTWEPTYPYTPKAVDDGRG